MKKKIIIGIILFFAAGALVLCYLRERTRKQAEVNIVAGIGFSFFEVDYPRVDSLPGGQVVRFPFERHSDKRAEKIFAANFSYPLMMLNLPFETYLKASRNYAPNAGMPKGLPLIWTKSSGVSGEYFTYWGVEAKGVMKTEEMNAFLAWARINLESPSLTDGG